MRYLLSLLPKWLLFVTSILALQLACFNVMSEDIKVDVKWRYTTEKPADGWEAIGFDDSGWKEGKGGFGDPGTPGSRVGTRWRTDDIWIRREFNLDAVPAKPGLLMHHDEDADVFINGKNVLSLKSFSQDYEVTPIAESVVSALMKGKNVIAVHCHQTGGGQYIDVHVVDTETEPTLPKPKPFDTKLITKWGSKVSAENTWREYPRPQMERGSWQNLNGKWDYAVTGLDAGRPTKWDGNILVPFCIESKLSGASRLLEPEDALWYHRMVKIEKKAGTRNLLNFEAVDYSCTVWMNGKDVGSHVGGSCPFSFDVTEAAYQGENELVIRVLDATGGAQLRGKQILRPGGIFYTRVSGIWQTVWMETVPERYIESIKIDTDIAEGTVTVRPVLKGKAVDGETLHAVARDGWRKVAETEGALTLKIKNPKLWSPSSPHLYDLEIVLLDAKGKEIDSVKSYTGLRKVGQMRDADENLRFTLNGEVIFHLGPLDQGWWPDGLLTPPSDDAMVYEIKYLKDSGFNMIRKHIKVEPRRYYYHCDRLGMMMWQDQVSGYPGPKWTRMDQNPEDAAWSDADHQQFMFELEAMIDHLENAPCIVVWVPFNEAWGQHRTMEVGAWTVKRDPTRLVNIASGGNYWPVGHIADHHSYPHPAFPLDDARFKDYIKVVGEFGGHGFAVQGHLWNDENANWGYGGLPKDKDEYIGRYKESIRIMQNLKAKGIAGGVYTQTTDVEGEINGLITYDREVEKISANDLFEIQKELMK